MSPSPKVALISGGNRGLGLETGRQLATLGGYTVILGSRDQALGDAACARLAQAGLTAETLQLDVTDPAMVQAAIGEILHRHGALHVLVNNAGIRLEMGSLLDTDPALMREMFEVNVVAQLRLAQLAVPHMQRAGYGRIVNVSSLLGQMSTMGAGQGAYKVSKASLNAVTAALAAELGLSPIKVNSASPGWTRTDMGGASATRSVTQGADTISWLATLPDDGPTGGFYHDRKLVVW